MTTIMQQTQNLVIPEVVLKAKNPEKKTKRLKLFLYGPAGEGKTLCALKFPNAYIIDTEKGTDFYEKTINASKSAVLQTLDTTEIKEQLKALLIVKHDYKTLIIDPMTQVYNSIQDKWMRIFEKYAKDTKDKEIQDFGMRYWQKVKSEYKAIERILLQLDMNVIVTAHQKDIYGANFSKIGVTFDSMKGDEYFFDLIFRLERIGNKRMAITVKERAEINNNKFPESFEWSYQNFCKFYGTGIIEKESLPVAMAKPEQVARINKLIETLNVEEDEINRWFAKANVESFDEMKEEDILKAINFLDKKLEILTKSEVK